MILYSRSRLSVENNWDDVAFAVNDDPAVELFTKAIRPATCQNTDEKDAGDPDATWIP